MIQLSLVHLEMGADAKGVVKEAVAANKEICTVKIQLVLAPRKHVTEGSQQFVGNRKNPGK